MKKCGKIVVSTAVLLLFFLTTQADEQRINIPFTKIKGHRYISLYSLSEQLKIDNSFDIITQRGRFYRGSGTSIYQVGLSVQLINGKLYTYPHAVMRRNGEVLFPGEFCIDLIAAFYPGVRITGTDDRLVLNFTGSTPDRQPVKTVSKKEPGNYPLEIKDRISFIIIDPGHGGKDPGAIGIGGLKEKNITLQLALLVEKLLKAKLGGMQVILTRKKDRFLELATRTEIANSHLKHNNNGIFISIHVNASISPKISGFETYFLSQNPSNEEARTTAALENDVIILEDRTKRKNYDDVTHMEAFMFMTQIQKESSLLAESIQREMDREIQEFKSRKVRKADFFVLRGVLMPAALIEVGYITNTRESGYLKKTAYQKKIAEGISNGIVSFIKKYNALIKNK